MQDKRYRLKLCLPSKNPLENSQHHIIKDFLAGDYDFWLSIDSDTAVSNNPLDLVEYDRDIIGLPYPIWHYEGKKGERPYYYSVYDYVSDKDAYREHEMAPGLQRVDAIGGGCFLISRRVFLDREMLKGAFTRKLYEDGTVHKGNDISFCERAREQGFEIYTHYSYPCRHLKEVELTEIITAFNQLNGS